MNCIQIEWDILKILIVWKEVKYGFDFSIREIIDYNCNYLWKINIEILTEISVMKHFESIEPKLS